MVPELIANLEFWNILVIVSLSSAIKQTTIRPSTNVCLSSTYIWLELLTNTNLMDCYVSLLISFRLQDFEMLVLHYLLWTYQYRSTTFNTQNPRLILNSIPEHLLRTFLDIYDSVYHVWHLDGSHKLIVLGFASYVCVVGYFRHLM